MALKSGLEVTQDHSN